MRVSGRERGRSELHTFAPSPPRPAFSLLEVILALAILTGAVAVVGELVRAGLRNAEIARDATHTQLLCESKMAEIAAGAMPLVNVADVPCETNPQWLYSVRVLPTPLEGLLAVEVTVYSPDPRRALSSFRLVRWMQDPSLMVVPATGLPLASGGR